MTIVYLRNVPHEMLMFSAHSLHSSYELSANNSCQFRKLVRVTGLDVQLKERIRRHAYKLESVRGRQNVKCRRKMVPEANLGKKNVNKYLEMF